MNDFWNVARACAVVGVGLLSGAANGQEYPAKPIKMVLATTVGSTQDLLARILNPKMSERLKQPIVLDYRPGAGNVLGFEYAAKQPGDGYTILMATVSQLALMPATVKELKFDALRDIPPFSVLAESRAYLVSGTKRPIKDFQNLISLAKASPGKLSYASAGPSLQIPVEAIKDRFSLDILHVPYSRSPDGYLAIVTGEVDIGVVSDASIHAFGEKLIILALSGDKRHPRFPNVPTFAEVGFPLLQGFSYSLNAPSGTPQPIIDKLHRATSETLKNPEVVAQLRKIDLEVVDQPPKDAIRNLAELGKFFTELAAKIGIKPQ